MGNKAVILVTTHTSEVQPDGNSFLKNFSSEHAEEFGVPNIIEFQKQTNSFAESASVIADKIKKIQEILNE
jgi:hypothetical protein